MNEGKIKQWSNKVIAGAASVAVAACTEQQWHIHNGVPVVPIGPYGVQAAISGTSGSFGFIDGV